MVNSRTFELFKTLDAAEIRALKKMVRSSFFNQRKDVETLFLYLENCIKKKILPTKEKAFLKMYANENYNDHMVRLTMSFLNKLIERYLVQKEIFADEPFVQSKLAAVFRKRNLVKHHEKIVRDASVKLEFQPRRDAKILENQLDLQLEEFQRKAAEKRTGELNLQSLSNQIDNIFIAKKLKQICLLISHQSVYKKDYNFGLLKAVIEKIETESLHEIPAIGMYYFAWKTLTNPSEVAHFQQFKKMVLQKGNLFPDDEMRDLTILAINFCIKKYNEGNHQFLEEEFEIYKEGLRKNYFLMNGQISRFTFRNIVTMTLVLKEYEWAQNFLNEYKPKLAPAYRETTYNFNLARLEYELKDYDKALNLLHQCDHKDLLLELSTRTLFLKIFYEKGSFELMDSNISSLQTFIRRKKIIGYHRDLYLNFSNFLTKLTNLPPGDKLAKSELLLQIENTERLAERIWLIKSVN